MVRSFQREGQVLGASATEDTEGHGSAWETWAVIALLATKTTDEH